MKTISTLLNSTLEKVTDIMEKAPGLIPLIVTLVILTCIIS